jgi:predicted O-methyltransferase YrrM
MSNPDYWWDQLLWLVSKHLGDTNDKFPGWLLRAEGDVLLRLTSRMAPGSVAVELGSFAGKATRYMLWGALLSESRLVCVDTFEASPDGAAAGNDTTAAYYKFLRDAGGTLPMFWTTMMDTMPMGIVNHHLDVMQATTEAAPWKGRPDISVLFVDADHSRALDDVTLWLPRMAEDSAIVLHDTEPGPKVYGARGPQAAGAQMIRYGWYPVGFYESNNIMAYLRQGARSRWQGEIGVPNGR